MRAIALAGLLLATPAMADDFPPGPGTSGVVTTDGVPVAGVFDFPGDADAFTVQLPANGRAFAVLLENTCHNKTVELYDAGFRLLRAPLVQGQPDQDIVVEWRAGYTGLYYVVVKDLPQPEGYICPVAASDSYTVSVGESCSPWIRTRCTIDHAARKDGRLRGVGDRNWYKFSLTERSWVTFDIEGPFGATVAILTLRRRDGRYITSTENPAVTCHYGTTCLRTNLCPGTYFVAARNDAITAQVPYTIAMVDDPYDGPAGTCLR
jgi:hypothetical protein